jgi:hypothetical protein
MFPQYTLSDFGFSAIPGYWSYSRKSGNQIFLSDGKNSIEGVSEMELWEPWRWAFKYLRWTFGIPPKSLLVVK